MAVTRASRNLSAHVKRSEMANSTKSVREVSTVTKVAKIKASGPKKSPQKKARIHFEQSLSHLKVPSNLELPRRFVETHDPNFVEGAEYIIKKDPSLYHVVVHENFQSFERSEEKDAPQEDEAAILRTYWYSLIRSVMGQQVSGASARAVQAKFCALFSEGEPDAAGTLQKSQEELRSAGLSNQKLKYVISISEAYSDPSSKLADLSFYESSDTDTLIDELVKLKGIGPWSAKMFLIFKLKRLDIFAHEDLGVARGMARYLTRRPDIFEKVKLEVKQDEDKFVLLKKKTTFDSTKNLKRDWVPLHDEYVKHVAERFSPYRSILMLILWRLSSTDVAVLETTD